MYLWCVAEVRMLEVEVSSLRPTQTLNSLLRPRVEKPCFKCKVGMRIPGKSYCMKCHNLPKAHK